MTRKELISYCLKFPSAYEDYPFGDEWAVMRHADNRKSFAFIYERNGRLSINLKCAPMEADFLRSVYSDVTPAYHMNKAHWNTVLIDGNVPENELYAMINRSFEFTKPAAKTEK